MKRKIIINPDDNLIIRKIKEYCLQKDWSYYRLSKETGISYSTIDNMLKNNSWPTLYTINRYCQAFGISWTSFLSEAYSSAPLSEEQQEILALWASLSDEKKEYAKETLYKLKEL